MALGSHSLDLTVVGSASFLVLDTYLLPLLISSLFITIPVRPAFRPLETVNVSECCPWQTFFCVWETFVNYNIKLT